MVLIRNEVVVAFLMYGMYSKGSGCGPIKYGIVNLEHLMKVSLVRKWSLLIRGLKCVCVCVCFHFDYIYEEEIFGCPNLFSE